ncbi:MFS transporter [Capsulimonas corticalis]|uniref:MFS transporter n=1 Tax=Capsulimonas corticalis TaxID=2219043 RepID=A0A402D1D1_9BACT|nr:MFS transporter [Capsulimonas corticalis]BDI31649.1 MFS transporter [Capsulimonas corticalis]
MMLSANKVVTEEPNEPRALPFWELWNMNFGYLGIQFGWGLQMANMAAIYVKLGADPDKIPILGLAGPVTGLLIQPIIGAMSDRTWSPRFGRRRPYFTLGAILASIALFFMPSSPALWVAATLLWILDASINVSMEPFRAFVADKLPVKQRAAGFLMQSFFIGLGATLANVLPWVLHHLGVAAQAANGVPLSVMYSFRVGAVAFLLAILWTVLKTPEDPPADMAEFERRRRETSGLAAGAREIAHALRMMPITMRQLFWVQFATWFGLSCFWGFFTLSVAQHVFGATDNKSPLFDRATEWAGVCMAAYSVVCFVVAPLLPAVTSRLGRPKLHALALALGGAGLLSVAAIHAPTLLLLPMAAFGIAWASILAMPYAILSVALPRERMGVYMGIFNFFIVLPQIVYSLFMPIVIKSVFHSNSLKTLLLGGFCLIIAAALATRVTEAAPISDLEPAVG